MKLSNDINPVYSKLSNEEHVFTIENNSKTFHLMMAALYTDPITAFVRELSTNAYESHQVAGCPDKPFEIELPSNIHPIFRIRDYGTGLSHKDVVGLYSVLMKSSKDNSNDLGGCFGLGSKSPFAYTDNYSVTSYHGGMKRVYAIYKNPVGVPALTLVGEAESDEPAGMEVSIPIKTDDCYAVIEKSREIYKGFELPPVVVGVHSGASFTSIHSKIEDGYHVFKHGADGIINVYAVCGNIIYEIEEYLVGKHLVQSSPENLSVYIKFNIGELTPTPSRDGLQYDNKTIKSISDKYDELEKRLSEKVQANIDSCTNYHDAISTFRNLSFIDQCNNLGVKYKDVVVQSLGTKNAHLRYNSRYKAYRGELDKKGGYDLHNKDYVLFVNEDCPRSYIRHKLQGLVSKYPKATKIVLYGIDDEKRKKEYEQLKETSYYHKEMDFNLSALPFNKPEKKHKSSAAKVEVKAYSVGYESLYGVAVEPKDIKYYVNVSHEDIVYDDVTYDKRLTKYIGNLASYKLTEPVYFINRTTAKSIDISHAKCALTELKPYIAKELDELKIYEGYTELSSRFNAVINKNSRIKTICEDLQSAEILLDKYKLMNKPYIYDKKDVLYTVKNKILKLNEEDSKPPQEAKELESLIRAINKKYNYLLMYNSLSMCLDKVIELTLENNQLKKELQEKEN